MSMTSTMDHRYDSMTEYFRTVVFLDCSFCGESWEAPEGASSYEEASALAKEDGWKVMPSDCYQQTGAACPSCVKELEEVG